MKISKATTTKYKALTIFTATVLLATGITACGGKASAESNGPVTIQFWNSASGAAGEVLKTQVDAFNKLHAGKITVNSIYQGDYATAISKFSSSVRSGATPDLLQTAGEYGGFLSDSKLTVPVTDLATSTAPYDFNNMVPIVRNYYTTTGKVQAMPYQVSLPVVGVNTELLQQAGVDPAKLGATVADLLATAETVHTKTQKAGITFHVTTWWNEQFVATSGGLYCTPANGTTTAKVTTFNVGAAAKTWQQIGAMGASGAFLNVGKDGNAAQTAFSAGEAAMILGSSAIAGNLAKSKVKVEYVPWPAAAGDAGVVPGGNAVWVVGADKTDTTKQAAWEFARYLGSDEIQKQTFQATGYLPTTQGAVKLASEGATPPQKQLLQVLSQAKANPVTAGCHSGAFNEVRLAVQPVLESVASGKGAAADLTALDATTTGLVARYEERAAK